MMPIGGDATAASYELAELADRRHEEKVELYAQLAKLSPGERRAAAQFRPLQKLADLVGRQQDRIRDLTRARWAERSRADAAEAEIAPLRGRVRQLEGDVQDLRRQLARALLLTGTSAPAAPREPEPVPRILPRQPLYVPADEARFAPPPDRDPREGARTVPAPPEPDPLREIVIVLLALTHRDIIPDDLSDITWSGRLTAEAASWLDREEPLPPGLRAALEARLLPADRARLRPDADPARIREAFNQAVTMQRREALRAELATAVAELDDTADEAAFGRLAALQALINAPLPAMPDEGGLHG